jgi:hypothetical protein
MREEIEVHYGKEAFLGEGDSACAMSAPLLPPLLQRFFFAVIDFQSSCQEA